MLGSGCSLRVHLLCSTVSAVTEKQSAEEHMLGAIISWVDQGHLHRGMFICVLAIQLDICSVVR